MGKIILVTGGARSGKSAYALKQAGRIKGPRVFIATAPAIDGEMEARIARHRRERDPRLWKTLEEQEDLAGALKRCGKFPVVLVDCLSLWVNNLLYAAEQKRLKFDEDSMARRMKSVLTAAHGHKGTTFFVTNEVGLGLVPNDPMSRLYRDLLGRCNQITAAAAAGVVLMVSGISMKIKGEALHETSHRSVK